MIGREKEARTLMRLYNGGKAELVAVYGRRRVGKTYLIDEVFRDRITFRHAGLSPVEDGIASPLKAQLEQFYYSLLAQGMPRSRRPESWLEAFFMLETFLQERDDGGRQVVFIDELPWLDTPRSGFMTAFEGFWNNWCCHRKNVMVIVCGSASSWVLDKLINNHGGLYGRVTYEIKLSPFTLGECEQYLRSLGVRLSRYDIAQSYMIFGGVPYYLGYFEPGLSLAQNVDNALFSKRAALSAEYDRLFASVFASPEYVKSIVEALRSRRLGCTKKEICEALGVSDGSRLTEALKALVASDFVVRYVPFGHSKRNEHYKLVDPFCVFWQHFGRQDVGLDERFWQSGQSTPAISAWRGLSFELACFNHIAQIKGALGIPGVKTAHSAWALRDGDAKGAQIDLVIERGDNIVTACEIKFVGDEFRVSADYRRTLLRREELLAQAVSPKMAVHTALITTFGLAYNEHSSAFSNVVTLDDLFA